MSAPVVNFDPIIFSLGPLQVRWYGLMYVVGFLQAGWLCKVLINKGFFQVAKEKIDSLITIILISMMIGARLTYVFVYNWEYYSKNLTELFSIWNGGLSFHGAVIGMFVGSYIYSKRNKIPWGQVMDVLALVSTPGIFWGRLGNLINGELYGRKTDSMFGLIFPGGGPFPRHPSQLYEGVLEGVFLTIVLWWLLKKVKNYGELASSFIIGYGIIRYFVEFFRQPDQQLGYYFGGTTTMGQILCLLMIVFGSIGMFIAKKKHVSISLHSK